MPAEFQRIKEIFLAAVEKTDPQEREAYLQDVCAGDETLLQKVAALLQRHEQAGNFLLEAAGEAVVTGDFHPKTESEGSAPSEPSPSTEAPGTRVGPYKLLEKIGEGGMGVVWMAEQIEPVRRRVALKVIKPGMDSAQVLARFEAERQAFALMDHPNFARVLDAGTTETGRPFFVMELIKGIPITHFCNNHRLTLIERLRLFIPVCQAVQHAHQKGIIHRDLKPSNVLVASYDGHPVPKVIDFGVAKAIGQQLTERTLFTGFGSLVGTLEYMSPEQAEFNALDIDTRSDIYSLGVLLYELLTGSTPLTRHRLKQVAITEVLRAIREEEPPRPSTRLSESREELASISAQRQMDSAQLTRQLRGELDWIVMKALEKDRGRRYESANGLARDLERCLADEPVEACPPSTGYRLRKFARKNRQLIATATAFVLLLLVGVVVAAWQALRATAAEREATQAEKMATEHFQEASTANDRLRQTQDELRNNLYTARARLIQSAWASDQVSRAVELLELQRPGPDEADLRGFEWDYWHRLCHAAQRTVKIPLEYEGIQPPCLSSDGRLIARLTATETGIQVWVGDPATGKERQTLKVADLDKEEKGVGVVTFTPDGARLAAAISITLSLKDGKDGPARDRSVIKVWDTLTGKELTSIRGTWGAVHGVALSSDGTRVAVSGSVSPEQDMASTHVWSIRTGQKLTTISEGATGGGLAFSPDGKRLAIPSYPRRVNKGSVVACMPAAVGLLANPHGQGHLLGVPAILLVDDEQSPGLKIWDANAGQELLALDTLGTLSNQGIAYSPDGKRIVAAVSPPDLGLGEDLQWWLQVWDAATGEQLLKIKRNPTDVEFPSYTDPLAFSPDGTRIACVDGGSNVTIWDAASGEELLTLKGHAAETLAFAGGGTQLVSATTYSITLWDATPGNRREHLPGHDNWEGRAVFSPDRSCFVNGDGTGNGVAPVRPYGLEVFDLSLKRVVQLEGPGNSEEDYRSFFDSFTWSGDGRRIAGAVGAWNGEKWVFELWIWDVGTGKHVRKFALEQKVWDLGAVQACFRADGSCLVAASYDHRDKEPGSLLKVWEATSGRELLTSQRDSEGRANLAFGAAGRLLAATSSPEGNLRKQIRLWDVATGNELHVLRGESDLRDLTFSPDGTRLAALSSDRAGSNLVLVWDTKTGERLSILKGHAGVGNRFVFSPDGRRIASVRPTQFSSSSEVHLWNVSTGDELLTLPVQARALALTFSPDGHRLVAVGSVAEASGSKARLSPLSTGGGGMQQGAAYITHGSLVQIWNATPRAKAESR